MYYPSSENKGADQLRGYREADLRLCFRTGTVFSRCGSIYSQDDMSRVSRKLDFAYAKTKAQISFAVTAKLFSTVVFATRIVQFLFFLNPKFPASSNLLCLYSSVCVRPGRTGFLMSWLIYQIFVVLVLLRINLEGIIMALHHLKLYEWTRIIFPQKVVMVKWVNQYDLHCLRV